jgi:nucleotide-binding universal stress UspA family protein
MLPPRLKIERILCPTDYSSFSTRALERAVRLARWFEARITVLHVIPRTHLFVPADMGIPSVVVPADLLRAQRQDEAEALEQFVAPFRGEGLSIATCLADGDPAHRIEVAADEILADLVVMGTHGRGGFERFVLGSVAEKVLRQVSCPVLIVGNDPTPERATLFRRILCAVDLGESSYRTLEVALSVAGENMARVTLLHVLEGLPGPSEAARFRGLPDLGLLRQEIVDEAEARLARCVPGSARELFSVTERVEEGAPWRKVLQIAAETDAELIVMGAHAKHAAFGSTVGRVVRRACCPVLVVRPTRARPALPREVYTARAGVSRPAETAVR